MKDIIEKGSINIKKFIIEIIDKIKMEKKLSTNELNLAVDIILVHPYYVTQLHKIVKTKNWKEKNLKAFFHDTESKSESNKLTNVIFDMTGDEEKKIINTAKDTKEKGYNNALVWVVTNKDIAELRNNQRIRTVKKDVFDKTHEGVKNTLFNFITSKIAGAYFDEIWLVINSASSLEKTTEKERELLDTMSCIQLIKKEDSYDFSKKTMDFIVSLMSQGKKDNSALQYLDDLKTKSKSKQRRQKRPAR